MEFDAKIAFKKDLSKNRTTAFYQFDQFHIQLSLNFTINREWMKA